MAEPKKETQFVYNSEQRVSLNAFVEVEVNGEFYKVQVTARHGAQSSEIVDNFNQLVDALATIGAQHPVTKAPRQTTNTPAGSPKQSTGYQSPRAYAGNDDTFHVENIKLASGGEHPRWVVQGGFFTKYGVTCWPEVLKDAGILDKLDPMNDNKPKGSWTAHYVTKPDGKPDKVTKLVNSDAPDKPVEAEQVVDQALPPIDEEDFPF